MSKLTPYKNYNQADCYNRENCVRPRVTKIAGCEFTECQKCEGNKMCRCVECETMKIRLQRENA